MDIMKFYGSIIVLDYGMGKRRLEQLADILILRYRKVKAALNPFDQQWQEYLTWKLRAKRELTKAKTFRKVS